MAKNTSAKGVSTKPSRQAAAASTNAQVHSNKPCMLVGGYIKNLAAAVRYVKLYDKATAPAPASDVPVAVFALSANETLPLYPIVGDGGIPFANGLGSITVTGAANTDATAVTANDIHMTLLVV